MLLLKVPTSIQHRHVHLCSFIPARVGDATQQGPSLARGGEQENLPSYQKTSLPSPAVRVGGSAGGGNEKWLRHHDGKAVWDDEDENETEAWDGGRFVNQRICSVGKATRLSLNRAAWIQGSGADKQARRHWRSHEKLAEARVSSRGDKAED